MTGVQATEMLGKGDYEYALPFYGERRPILIDLVLLPRQEFEQKYAHIRRDGEILVGETYVPRLRGARRLPVCHRSHPARRRRRTRGRD